MKFTTLLKSTLLLFTGFIIGILFGWHLFGPSDPVSMKNIETAHLPIQTPQQNVPIATIDSPKSSFSLPKVTIQLIQNQKIEPAITLLAQIDLESDDNMSIKQHLYENLAYLRDSEDWQKLNEWLSKLMELGFNDSQLYRLHAESLISNQQYGAALDALHIAIQNAPSLAIEDQINKQIDQLIAQLTSDYLSRSITISYPELLTLLESAREKRPEHPPISIQLAQLYASQGRLQEAIDILALLPYGSNFDTSLSTLKTQLASQLTQQALIKTGIPLIKIGSQYIVTVIINQEVTLNLLLDTGASYTALSSEAINRIESETGGIYYQNQIAWVNTANGKIQSRVYTAEALAVEQFILRDARILEANFDENSRVDGLLGMDFLSHFQFKIDYEHSMLYLTPNA